MTSVLEEIGVEVGTDPSGIFDVEVACSQFFPNHIVGVIEKCLSGKNRIEKLEKAQDQGWRYFDKPTFDFLVSRTVAHQPSAPPIPKKWDRSWAGRVYSIVTGTFLVHDMNRREADALLFDIPNLCSDRNALMIAVRAAKERDIRTTTYLKGILERMQSKRAAAKREREAQPETFKTFKRVTQADLDEVENNWLKAQKRIDMKKGFGK